MKLFMVSILALTIISCGGGESNNSTKGNTSGIITLSGDDTSIVGTKLDTGFIGASPAAGSQPDYITIVDKSSSVTFTPPNTLTPDISDPSNGFILVVSNDGSGSGIKGISMSIITGGTKLDYACSNPVSSFIDCGTNSIDLNIVNKTVKFSNAAVSNTATGSVLIIDGTLTWNGNSGSDMTEPEEVSNSLTLSGNDVGTELVRDLVLDIAETYSDPGDVNGFMINNNNSSNGTNTFLDMNLNFDSITGFYDTQLHVANSSNESWKYECNDDLSNYYQVSGCDGKITINEGNRTFIFNNVILYPIMNPLSDSDQATSPLTVNGVLIWSLQ